MKLILERHDSSDEGTFGRLILPDFTVFTGELPWRDNQSNISCIPEGIYNCVWTFSEHFRRNVYLLTHTGLRTGIRIHPANLMGDKSKGFKCQLNGCIALGTQLGWMNGQKALLCSVTAIRRFESYLDHKNFELEIKSCGH